MGHGGRTAWFVRSAFVLRLRLRHVNKQTIANQLQNENKTGTKRKQYHRCTIVARKMNVNFILAATVNNRFTVYTRVKIFTLTAMSSWYTAMSSWYTAIESWSRGKSQFAMVHRDRPRRTTENYHGEPPSPRPPSTVGYSIGHNKVPVQSM